MLAELFAVSPPTPPYRIVPVVPAWTLPAIRSNAPAKIALATLVFMCILLFVSQKSKKL